MTANAYFASLTPEERRAYESERAKLRNRAPGPRARTERLHRTSKRQLDLIRADCRKHPGDDDKPRTRGDCANVQRPCPWVSCKWNLYLDVTASGSIKFNWPDREPSDVDPACSCALDVADRGGVLLEDIARCLNLTRERARQIEEMALHRLDVRVLEEL